MADISNVITAQLLAEGQSAARDNMNVVAILTSERTHLNSSKRYDIYRTSSSVATDFGTLSKTNDFASTFFATEVNPISAGGALVIGYWRATAETVPATAATLTGVQLSEATVIGQLQEISDGSFSITIDGTEKNVAGLNFQSVVDLNDVVEVVQTGLEDDALVSIDDSRIIISSSTTGATSTITALTPLETGSFIGSVLGLESGGGVVVTQGAAESTLEPETKLEAITALKQAVNAKGATFIDNTTDAEKLQLATFAVANDMLIYDVFSSSSNLVVSNDNPMWQIKTSGLQNFRGLHSKAGNRKLAVSYMARAHVVNFSAENTAMTMHLKTLAVPAEDYTQGEIDAAKRVGLDIYTTIKDVSVVLTSHANGFVDNVYNLMAFIDAVQTDMFNLLKTTPTKIPQTTAGVNQLVDQAEKTTREFVRAGVFAPGTWSLSDFFGNRDTFMRSIEQNGFYWLAGLLSEQSQADRQQRKSPVLQCAVKNAGAIHSVETIILFNQ